MHGLRLLTYCEAEPISFGQFQELRLLTNAKLTTLVDTE
jgi:hypothetical protein